MKKLLFGLVIVVIVTLLYITGQLFFSQRSLSDENGSLKARLDLLRADSKRLQADIQYFAIPENLEKYLRGVLNYKNPGEKLIIAVPGKDNSTTTADN